jgi:hypothetical protein
MQCCCHNLICIVIVCTWEKNYDFKKMKIDEMGTWRLTAETNPRTRTWPSRYGDSPRRRSKRPSKKIGIQVNVKYDFLASLFLTCAVSDGPLKVYWHEKLILCRTASYDTTRHNYVGLIPTVLEGVVRL